MAQFLVQFFLILLGEFHSSLFHGKVALDSLFGGEFSAQLGGSLHQVELLGGEFVLVERLKDPSPILSLSLFILHEREHLSTRLDLQLLDLLLLLFAQHLGLFNHRRRQLSLFALLLLGRRNNRFITELSAQSIRKHGLML